MPQPIPGGTRGARLARAKQEQERTRTTLRSQPPKTASDEKTPMSKGPTRFPPPQAAASQSTSEPFWLPEPDVIPEGRSLNDGLDAFVTNTTVQARDIDGRWQDLPVVIDFKAHKPMVTDNLVTGILGFKPKMTSEKDKARSVQCSFGTLEAGGTVCLTLRVSPDGTPVVLECILLRSTSQHTRAGILFSAEDAFNRRNTSHFHRTSVGSDVAHRSTRTLPPSMNARALRHSPPTTQVYEVDCSSHLDGISTGFEGTRTSQPSTNVRPSTSARTWSSTASTSQTYAFDHNSPQPSGTESTEPTVTPTSVRTIQKGDGSKTFTSNDHMAPTECLSRIVTWNPPEKHLFVNMFAAAMIVHLPKDSALCKIEAETGQLVLPHLVSALETFVEIMGLFQYTRTTAVGVQIVRRLKNEIARQFQDDVASVAQLGGIQRRTEHPAVVLMEIMDHFASQPAFENLVRTAARLLERYENDKMKLILRRVSASMHEPNEQHYRAGFHVDWDLGGFLANNYEAGVHQKLGQIVAVTRFSKSAVQMCSVGQYIRQCWPRYSSQLLLALQEAVMTPDEIGSSNTSEGHIKVNAQSVFTRGTSEFIIAIAQQLSWLAGVFQEKKEELTHAYVAFEADEDDSAAYPTFSIGVEFGKPEQDGESCWKQVVGPAVVVTGFPVPPRDNNERGLEVSAPVMAVISGTPQAVTFSGGFVLKGRCHALVPVEKLGDSVQWHLVDTYPRRLEWHHIDKVYPIRLLGEEFETLLSSRSFLGWCPEVLDYLATKTFGYRSIRYSKAEKPSKRPQIDKFVVGFSQWGTITADITLGKRDGYHAQRPDSYDTLLEDAKRTQVILHDTDLERAVEINAEDLILQTLLHRWVDNAEVPSSNIQFANPARRKMSTRQAMLNNAEKAIAYRISFSSSQREEIRFKHEVKRVYETLEGLWAHSYAQDTSSIKLGPESTHAISGWEYMDVVRDSRKLEPKSVNLKNTCGDWNRYAKEIKAIVIFGANFGDIFVSAANDSHCPHSMSLPRDKCYLGVRVDALEFLFERQGCLEDQTKLTGSGLTLHGPKEPFMACRGEKPCGKHCFGQRVVRLARAARLEPHYPLPLRRGGAIVIGEVKHQPVLDRLLRREHGRRKQTSRRKSQPAIPSIETSDPQDLCDSNRESLDVPMKDAVPELLQTPSDCDESLTASTTSSELLEASATSSELQSVYSSFQHSSSFMSTSAGPSSPRPRGYLVGEQASPRRSRD